MNAKRHQLLRVAVKALGMCEADYRALLRDYGGVDSATRLTEHGFDQVMARLRQLGFTSSKRHAGYGERAGMASAGQIELIRSLWSKVADNPTEADLNRWIEGHFIGGVSSLRFLTAQGASKVIGALRSWEARRASQISAGQSVARDAPDAL